MLTRLSISNYALIKSLDTEFFPGLSTITGSTGAGKSIILGAVSLLLGARADLKKASDPESKTIVEGHFDISKFDISPLLAELNIPCVGDNLLILRREILPGGRSRAFVNDSPVSIKTLSQLAERVVDIHSQHKNTLILSPSYRLAIIDTIADNAAVKADYQAQFRKYVSLRLEIQRLREETEAARQEEEYLRFRLDKITRLNLKKGELESLRKKEKLLDAAASLTEVLDSITTKMYSDTAESVISNLYEVKTLADRTDLEPVLPSGSNNAELRGRIASALEELKDINDTFTRAMSQIEVNPALLQDTRQRLNDIYDLLHYFKVDTDEALLNIAADLKRRLDSLQNASADIDRLQKQLRAEAAALTSLADTLTHSRMEAAARFSQEITRLAAPLGMPNVNFQADIQKGKLSVHGQDNVDFLCAFNKNQPLIPLADGASGGEISRVMLCIKALMAARMALPTIIFDEIDTGVSGQIASKMGDMMRSMARDLQVIVITHLPQVAAKGEHQYTVFKHDTDSATTTNIQLLTPEKRVEEIARMLAGEQIDDAAILNAKSLLQNGKE